MQTIRASQHIGDSYLNYSLKVVQDRAIPDCYDGLKPVQRRILYAMYDLGLLPTTPTKKCARIVGEAIGKYHPHSDCLVGDTVVFLLDGTTPTIKELYERGESVEVLSFDENLKTLVPTKAHSFRIGQYSNKNYKITLSNGGELETTGNHSFLIDGTAWIQAKDLKVGMFLTNYGYSVSQGRPSLGSYSDYCKNSSTLIQTYVKDYLRAKSSKSFKNLVLHHLDENTFNNTIENSQLMERVDHHLFHHDLASRKKQLAKGLESQFSSTPWMRKIIEYKNKELSRLNLPRFQIIRVLNSAKKIMSRDPMTPLTQDLLEKGRENSTPKFQTLLDKGLLTSWDEFLTLLEKNELPKLNYSRQKVLDDVIRDFPEHRESIVAYESMREKTKIPHKSFGPTNELGACAHGFSKIIRRVIELELDPTWENYDLVYAREFKRSSEFGFSKTKPKVGNNTPIDFHKKCPKTALWITKIETLDYDQSIPMYDFTVDEHQNMLIQTGKNCYSIAHNSSLYDTLVKLAQDFTTRYPLIKGQGNLGSLDHPPAAHRYTEATLSKVGYLLFESIDHNTVQFQKNFDESEEEPVLLPSPLPQLLINGSIGIAVGLSTNIFPHHISDVIATTIHVIDYPDACDEELSLLMQGPDFPGGCMVDTSTIESVYRTGNGSVQTRARAHVEKRKDDKCIVITHLPPIDKIKVLEKLVKILEEKSIRAIRSISDESRGTDVKIVLTLKQTDTPVATTWKDVCKRAGLIVSVKSNMIALCNSRPTVVNVRKIIDYWLEKRIQIITSEKQFTIDKLERELALVKLYLRVIELKSKILKVIYEGETEEQLKQGITALGFTEEETNTILNLAIKRLSKMSINELKTKKTNLIENIKQNRAIISSSDSVKAHIRAQLLDIDKRYSDERRCLLVDSKTFNNYDLALVK